MKRDSAARKILASIRYIALCMLYKYSLLGGVCLDFNTWNNLNNVVNGNILAETGKISLGISLQHLQQFIYLLQPEYRIECGSSRQGVSPNSMHLCISFDHELLTLIR